jgi:hypothetical protein
VFTWPRLLVGSFVGDLMPYLAAAAGVGLLVGCVVVLVSGEARSNPALVILGAILAGVAVVLMMGVLVLALAARGD